MAAGRQRRAPPSVLARGGRMFAAPAPAPKVRAWGGAHTNQRPGVSKIPERIFGPLQREGESRGEKKKSQTFHFTLKFTSPGANASRAFFCVFGAFKAPLAPQSRQQSSHTPLNTRHKQHTHTPTTNSRRQPTPTQGTHTALDRNSNTLRPPTNKAPLLPLLLRAQSWLAPAPCSRSAASCCWPPRPRRRA